MLFLVQQDAGRINPVILTAAIALIKLLRIIRNANANANDSHVDYHITLGVDYYRIVGSSSCGGTSAGSKQV